MLSELAWKGEGSLERIMCNSVRTTMASKAGRVQAKKRFGNRSTVYEGVFDDVQYVFVVRQSERVQRLTVGVRATLSVSSKTKVSYAFNDFVNFQASYTEKNIMIILHQ